MQASVLSAVPVPKLNAHIYSQRTTCKILIIPFKKTAPYTENTPLLKPNNSPTYPPKLNSIQKLLALTLDKLEKSLIIPLELSQKLAKTADPKIQISGNFAPVDECPVRNGLNVVGLIPESLHGTYIRNGANPMFSPLGGHHFFDGDGMLHAVGLGPKNEATYSCRYTQTSRLVQEAALGRPIFLKCIGELHGHSGLARLALFLARSRFGLIDDSQGTGVANTGVVYFNGRLLAMSEDDRPYHVKIEKDGDLQTIGRHNFDDQLDCPMIAHPKLDPITGDLHGLSYNVLNKPYLKYVRFDSSGKKSCDLDISLGQPTMIHDFAITENSIVIPDHQVVFKLSEMVKGGSPVILDKDKTSRFGVLSKKDSDDKNMKWIDVPDCFCFHLWNAWEEISSDGDKIVVVIGSCMTPADAIFNEKDDRLRCELSEIRLNMSTGESYRRVIVPTMNLEAGQVNKQLLGKKTKYVYVAIADPWPRCSGIAKVDIDTGKVTKYMYGNGKYGGEPCYVPEKISDIRYCEDDGKGFILGHVRDEIEEISELVIVDASSMVRVASINLPSRVPYGIHGTFVSAEEIKKQVV